VPAARAGQHVLGEHAVAHHQIVAAVVHRRIDPRAVAGLAVGVLQHLVGAAQPAHRARAARRAGHDVDHRQPIGVAHHRRGSAQRRERGRRRARDAREPRATTVAVAAAPTGGGGASWAREPHSRRSRRRSLPTISAQPR
jgi:hypothetical protein